MKDIAKEAAKILYDWDRHIQYIADVERKDGDSLTTHEQISLIVYDKFTSKELVKEICGKGNDLLMMNCIEILDFCSDELRNDPDVALCAIKTNSDNMGFLNIEFKDNKDFILKAVSCNEVLLYVSDRLKDDEDVVHLSVENFPKTIISASERFQKDKSLIGKLLNKDSYVINYIHASLRNDADLFKEFWDTSKNKHSDNHMLLHYHAQTLTSNMVDDLKGLFSCIDLEKDNEGLIKQMDSCFDKFYLNKELNTELYSSQNKQDKKIKL